MEEGEWCIRPAGKKLDMQGGREAVLLFDGACRNGWTRGLRLVKLAYGGYYSL